MNGILNVNKLQGWTSFDVVNYLKRVFKTGHIGHLGTLDPMATGVLPVTIGSATKLFDMFLKKQKSYLAEFEFGYLTDTLDKTGQIKQTTNIIPTKEEIEKILPMFVGEIEQIPPQFSAKKVNGKKACDVARSGGQIELKPNKIIITSLEIVDYSNQVLTLKIECGAGTYIRVLGNDIAQKLNSYATMTKLTRTQVGKFMLEDAIDIKSLTNEEMIAHILPTDYVFQNLSIIDDITLVKKLLNGQKVKTDLSDGEYRLYCDNIFVALATAENNIIKMKKFFG